VLRFLGVADLFFAARPVFRDVFFALFLAGTFAPFFRASDKPIAIACLRLVTFLPDLPEVKVPFFFLRIALATVLPAFFEYLAITFSFVVEKKQTRKLKTPKANNKNQTE
jgi:hypothetical protein